jgi:hypothetical protein
MLGDTLSKPKGWGAQVSAPDENATYDVFTVERHGLSTNLYVRKIDAVRGASFEEAQERYREKKHYAVDFHYANGLMIFPVGTIHDGCLDDQTDCG